MNRVSVATEAAPIWLLDDEESAALRDRLIAELDDLTSADEAAN
jgi:hypothetical protein